MKNKAPLSFKGYWQAAMRRREHAQISLYSPTAPLANAQIDVPTNIIFVYLYTIHIYVHIYIYTYICMCIYIYVYKLCFAFHSQQKGMREEPSSAIVWCSYCDHPSPERVCVGQGCKIRKTKKSQPALLFMAIPALAGSKPEIRTRASGVFLHQPVTCMSSSRCTTTVSFV